MPLSGAMSTEMCLFATTSSMWLLVPVAGVGGDRLGQLIDPGPLKLIEGGGDHRGKL